MSDEPDSPIMKMDLQAPLPQNPWARISDVAARLGVQPVEWGKAGTIVAKGADGNSYDLWQVVIAFLDRMDQHD